MRYLTIPKPVELPATDGQVHQYEFSDLLADQVWCHEFWRAASGRDLSDLFFDLVGKFEFATEAGDVVELTDAEHEIMLPLVTMRGNKLNPRVAVPLQRLMRCIIIAPTKPPPRAITELAAST